MTNHAHTTPIFYVMFPASGASVVSEVDYSGDSETDELVQVSIIFRFPPGGRRRMSAQNQEISHRWEEGGAAPGPGARSPR